ncbi:MAG: FtsH protease activity modulator HflK [Rickettsiales bacterium]
MTVNKGGPWGSSGGGTGSGGTGGKGPNRPNTPNDQPDLEELLRKSKESLRGMFGNGGGNGSGSGGGFDFQGPRLIILIGLGLLVLWFASGIYRVDADEQGVVLRFGEYHRTTEPGLNYHLPYPIEQAFTPRVTTINREQIGFRSMGNNYDNRENRSLVPEESLMLTGDKNIVSAQFEVQWRIKDAGKYLFNLRTPDFIVKPVAETAMREIMGNTALSLALSDKRQSIAEATQDLMQSILDEYQSGIEIFEVNLLAVDAPQPVVDAFIDVLSSQQEKETLRNQAMKYRDGILPVAQGQAAKMVQDAEAYREAVVSRAEGEASRFKAIYKEYKNAEDVTRQRIYLETMEEVLGGMNKVILDDKASNGVLPYLPLPEVQRNRNVSDVPAATEEAR